MDSAFYATEIPVFLQAFCSTPLLVRLRNVGMNCGVEYTHFARFLSLPAYSRYDHSLGVALIVWRFTFDKAATLAALCHDVATPTFAHTVDFLYGDYLLQESTERDTLSFVRQDKQAMALLAQYGISLDAMSPAIYPVAETPSPRLCADRLEYTLGNAYGYGFASRPTLRALYDDLVVADTPQGQELAFRTLSYAAQFGHLALRCGEVYSCDEDRYAMQRLSEVLFVALQQGVILPADLYTTEPRLIALLQSHPATASLWQAYCALSRMHTVGPKPQQDGRIVQVKRRYIDPYIVGQGRLSVLDERFAAEVARYLSLSQDEQLCGL